MNLDETERRFNAATPGPWRAAQDWDWLVVVPDGTYPYTPAVARNLKREDAEFIAHAREDVPALVSEMRRLLWILREMRNCIGRPVTNTEHSLLVLIEDALREESDE